MSRWDLGRLAEALTARPARRSEVGALRAAAVLVPLVPRGEGELELLFLVRPSTLLTHPGQVAFPGGRLDPEDVDHVAAALRESEEELGIPRAAPRILGRLDDLNTHTGFHVTPIVAVLPPDLVLSPSPGEVASTFTVALAALADPRARRSVRVRRAGGREGVREIRLHFWPEHGPVIWGVTGHILANLLDVIGP